MKKGWLLALLGACSAQALEVTPVAPHLYRYVLEADVPGFGRVPANGIIELEGNKALLVDTGWNQDQGRELLNWIQSKGIKDIQVVLTHSHADRAGGVKVFLDAGLTVWAHEKTAALLKEPRLSVWSGDSLKLGPVEVFYPGAGHSPDNLVVWFQGQRLLFGGCLVKDVAAKSLGNLEDADLRHWPEALKAVGHRYPGARLVIPGHGDGRGPGAINHSLALLEKR
ncbi:subclass B1 metallo-beta-lactamase [Gallaecimonas kandeliae]|uniref:subclass B1 metallo-beta-lactamase n=1 Tax=Gallaecimonas kandeliae TaxID=3029055 RepID=UPI002647F18B|nr:subclass B1 metallo-beta-lactamase [Gallaecimonas kandeliae]WKE65462.1 subclass B1 metallo-beta-lactamase [Gallaecimonas kandeliae]